MLQSQLPGPEVPHVTWNAFHLGSSAILCIARISQSWTYGALCLSDLSVQIWLSFLCCRRKATPNLVCVVIRWFGAGGTMVFAALAERMGVAVMRMPRVMLMVVMVMAAALRGSKTQQEVVHTSGKPQDVLGRNWAQ